MPFSLHRGFLRLAVAGLSMLAGASTAVAADTWTDPHPGIRHLHRETASQQIHVLLVDLSRPELRVRATQSDDRGATVSDFAETYGLAVAINGDFWQWEGYTTSGLSVGDGMQWPGENDNTTEGFIAFGVDNAAEVSPPAELLEAPEAWMSDVVGGRPLVADGGVALDPTTCDPHFCALHPRTAVGVSADRKTLILAAIDGRTSIAAGMTTRQVGELMVEMGADIALNFDGGGSTAMYVDTEGGVVNSPSDGSERVVANHLGVEIVDPIGTLRGTVRSSMGEPLAGALVELSTGAMMATDAAGSFELVDVAAGDTIASASHPDWLPAEVSVWVSAQAITETELVLVPRPPSAGTSSDGGEEEDDGPASDDDGSDGSDDSSGSDGSGDDGVLPPASDPAGTDGCGCSTAPTPGVALGGLVLLGLVRRRRRAAIVAIAIAGGCASAEAQPDAPRSTSFVRFSPSSGAPLDFGAVPFPSDLYRGDDGRFAIGALPNPRTDEPMFAAIRAELATRDGACTSCNISFFVEGALDEGTLPVSALPGDTATLDDAVVLVDVDPDSPQHGDAIPLRVQWEPDIGRLAVRAARGFAVHGGRRYAAVTTTALHGADGLPLAASPAFAAILDGTDDPELATADEILAPTLDALAELGLDRDDIAGLAAFTTEDPTADAQAIRAAIHAGPIPAAVVDAVWTGAAVDELLGVPATPGPGIDREPAAGTEGTAAIAHDTTRIVIAGRFPAPRFRAGTGTDVGAPVRDAAGAPTATATEDVPFVLTIPAGADLARLPVVISHHGFNASRTTGFVLADTAGRAGWAVLAIDAYQHGERAASADDRIHAMRGDVDGPDGFSETAKLDVSMRVFGLAGTDSDMTLFPGFPLAAFEQFAADSMATVRFVRDGDLTALRSADPMLASLAFDRDRIAFVGNSMGAVVGTSVAVAEPDVDAIVLDVLPGSIVDTLVESAEFRPLTETLLLPILAVDGEFDEQSRALVFDPTVDLFRWVLEPVDPLALAPYLVHERVAGPAPDLLIQLAGHDEVAAPAASESVVAAAGVPAVGTFAFVEVEPAPAPAVGNLADASIAAVRLDPAMHGMLEVSRQSSRWADPLVPPLVERDAPQSITNPIEPVHAQIEVFLTTYRQDGRAAIVP